MPGRERRLIKCSRPDEPPPGLKPPLSGSYSCLCQDARGCDVRSSGFAIDVAFALDGLGFSLAGGDPPGVDMARQFHQPLGDGAWAGLTPDAPVLGRQGDEHALVAALYGQSEMERSRPGMRRNSRLRVFVSG